MKNKFLLLFIALFFLPLIVSATHIVGGSLTYEQLGGSTYRITLKLYRDCAAGNAAFDNTITIEVLQPNGSAFVPSKNISINIGTVTKLNPFVDTCVVKPNVCVEEAIYTKVVNNLPPNPGGYHIFWQRCCRNGSILNINNPLNSGESFYTYIPDNNNLINNSSPTWVNSPPTFVCQGTSIDFNHAATDADGDSLVYSFYNPYLGCNGTTVQSPNCPTDYPTFPGNVATFNSVSWKAGYTSTNPLGGGGLTLSKTGFLQGIPPALGQYVVGVKCEEWRNGVKIGEILRDFQFNVVSCPPLAVPNFTSAGQCSGTAVTFTNTTNPAANSYSWDFGDPTVTTDVSNATSPSYTYPTLGTYTVTLIANAGTACADTVIKTVFVSSVTAAFTNNIPGCVGLPISFTDQSTSAAGSTLSNWLWKFGDGTTSPTQNPSHVYNTAGTFTVTLIVTSTAGCTDSIKKTLTIKNPPVPNFTTSGVCQGTNVTFTNTTAPAGDTYFWDFGNTNTPADTSVLTSPSYNYPAPGTYTVTLIVNKGSSCAKTITKIINVASVVANFTDNRPGCVGMSIGFTDSSVVSSNTTIISWEWDFGDFGLSNLQNPTHTYIAIGTYDVQLIVTTAAGCKDTIIRQILIQNAPVPNFTSSGVCNGKTIKFTNTSVPGGGSYFWDFGNITVPSDTSVSTNPSYTYPTVGNYTVTLIVNKGSACAITITKKIVLTSITANFTNTATGCKDVGVSFTDQSTTSSNATLTGWSWDFGDTGTSNVQNPTHPYSAPGTYTVTLVVTSSSGCKDTIAHVITIEDSPVANAGNDTISCTNNPGINLKGTILNATGGQWVGTGTFLPSDTSLNVNYTPTPTAILNGKDTLLFYTVGTGACPPDTDMVIITFYAGPTANGGSNISVCKDNDSIPVCATITVASGVTWNTLGTGTFLNANQLCTAYTPSSADTTAGSVIVYITTTGNGNCLAARDSVTITFTPRPIVNIKSNDTSCANNPVPILVTTTTGSGTWSTTSSSPGTFLPNNGALSGTYTPSAFDNAAGKVTLVFSSSNNGGCKSSYDTIHVILIPAPTAAFTSTSVCPGFPVAFTDATVPVGSVTSWTWDFGDTKNNTSPLQNPSHTYDTGGPYSVSLIVNSANGCKDTAIQTVNVFQKPIANFYQDGLCQKDGGMVFLDSSIVTGSTITTWNWNFGDSTPNDPSQNPLHNYATNGTFLVTLMVESAQGCKDTIQKNVGVLPGPQANFTASDYKVYINEQVNFTDKSTTAPTSWLWDFGDSSPDSTSTLQNPSHKYAKGGFYDVCLYITDANGCRDTACQTIIVALPPVVPTGFSPNNDGENDIWYVYGGPFKTINIKIYNNWGELIFESDKQSHGWDGKRKGIDQAIGVYVWIVVGDTEDDKHYELSGDVTLLR